jgi:hypothetical protein
MSIWQDISISWKETSTKEKWTFIILPLTILGVIAAAIAWLINRFVHPLPLWGAALAALIVWVGEVVAVVFFLHRLPEKDNSSHDSSETYTDEIGGADCIVKIMKSQEVTGLPDANLGFDCKKCRKTIWFPLSAAREKMAVRVVCHECGAINRVKLKAN